MKKNIIKLSILLMLSVSLFLTSCNEKVSIEEKVTQNKNLLAKDILEEIKNIHPGVSGSSLKALQAVYDIMTMANSNEEIHLAFQNYVNSMKKEDIIDYQESLNIVKDQLMSIDINKIDSIFSDIGIKSSGFIASNYDYAVYFINELSNLVNRDLTND